MMSLTRWQSFRYQHRHSAIKQVLYLTGFVFLICLYMYAFFFWQERSADRSHATIETWNMALQDKARIEWTDRRAKRIRAKELREEEKIKKRDGSNEEEEEDDDENTPKRQQQHRERTLADRLMDMILVSYVMSLMLRVYARIHRRHHQHHQQLLLLPRTGRSFFRHQRLLQQRRRERFQQWANRLNAQRVVNGQAPISLTSLELVMREERMTGDDYDNLLQFDQEAGPAMEALLNGGMGASPDEINRCPVRILQPGDELLSPSSLPQQQQQQQEGTDHYHPQNQDLLSPAAPPQHCAICLEQYQAGDQIRTIPCFHHFHKHCVDPWLAQRAVCPVCKHSAIA